MYDSSFLRSLPGLFLIKNIDSVFLNMTFSLAKLVGWETAEESLGKTDHDVPCKASEFASQFISLDKRVIESRKSLLTLEVNNFPMGLKANIVERNILYGENNQVLGIFTQLINISDTSSTTSDLVAIESLGQLAKNNPNFTASHPEVFHRLLNILADFAYKEHIDKLTITVIKTLRYIKQLEPDDQQTLKDFAYQVLKKISIEHQKENILLKFYGNSLMDCLVTAIEIYPAILKELIDKLTTANDEFYLCIFTLLYRYLLKNEVILQAIPSVCKKLHELHIDGVILTENATKIFIWIKLRYKFIAESSVEPLISFYLNIKI